MRTPVTARRLATAAGALALLGAVWLLLAPPALGGRTSWVTTDGTSMAPRFHSGDLALVRVRAGYRVGEIVAYRSAALETIVLHRIVGRTGNRFLFKGDANDYLDPQPVAPDALVGALWLHVPGASRWLSPLRSRWSTAALADVGLLLLLAGGKRRRRRRSDDTRRVRRGAEQRARPTSLPRVPALAAAAAAALGFGALASIAYTRPATSTTTRALPYRQSGTFSYSARTRRSVAYPRGRVATGDPIFLQLVGQLRVRFAYHLSAAARHDVGGTISLEGRLASSSGWQTTLPLAAARQFDGDSAIVTGMLDLAPLPRLLDRLESATDVGGMRYTLTVVPTVRVTGRLGGARLAKTFAPQLAFTLDPLVLRLDDSGPTALAAHAAGSLTLRRPRPAALSLLGRRLAVTDARTAGALGSVIAAVLLLAIAAAELVADRRRDEAARIRTRYRDWVVAIAPGTERALPIEAVAVEDIETLVRLAERYDRLILHERREDGDEFAVADGGLRYVYRAAPAAKPRRTYRAHAIHAPAVRVRRPAA